MNHKDETNLKLLIAFASLLQFHDYRHVPLNPVKSLEQWFSTCGSEPLGVEWLFQRAHPRSLEISDIYVMIHNSRKITVMKYKEK